MFDGHRLRRIQRHKIDDRFKPAHVPLLANGGINRKDRANRKKKRQQNPIDKGDMVGDNQHALAVQRLCIARESHTEQDAKEATKKAK